MEIKSRARTRLVAMVLAFGLVGATACASGAASKDGEVDKSYPNHAINWIVPFEPGGGSDRQVRRLQPGMEKALGQKINVVYKTGGAGAVGWQEAFKAAPDGYTVCNVVTPDINVLPLDEKTGYKPKGFEYVTWTETSPNGIVVPKKSRFKSIESFVAAAKKNPGKLTVAGVGKTSELYWTQMADSMGIKATYVPVTGGLGEILPDLQGGHVDAAVFGVASLEQKETIRVLALSGKDQVKALPNVPTFHSKGYRNVTLGTSWGIAAPPGTPKQIVAKLNKAAGKAMRNKEVQEKLKRSGLTSLNQSPQEARKFARDQHKTVSSVWNDVHE